MVIIGIYGYIGAGKTIACNYLVDKYNFLYLNADLIAKKLMESSEVLNFLQQQFPTVIINNKIDRQKLRTIIFTDEVANHTLNTFLWPKVNEELIKIINQNLTKNILIEAVGLNNLTITFTTKIFITAAKKTILQRVKIRDARAVNETKTILKIQKNLFYQFTPDFKIKTKKNKNILYNKLDQIMKKILGEKI